MNILQTIIDNKISIDYCGKTIWAGVKNSSGVVIRNAHVKFKDVNSEAEALELVVKKVLEG